MYKYESLCITLTWSNPPSVSYYGIFPVTRQLCSTIQDSFTKPQLACIQRSKRRFLSVVLAVEFANANTAQKVQYRLASYPGHVGGGKSGLVSTVCACAKNTMISWGIVYHRLRTVNLYRIAPKHVRLELVPRTAGKT